jgi:hypothetical protein
VTYTWKQFNIHRIKMREPPELDFAPEGPCTLGDLVSLHIDDLGYSVADLARMQMIASVAPERSSREPIEFPWCSAAPGPSKV